jgi:DNA-binding LacI/PurR family transcriptional regulator
LPERPDGLVVSDDFFLRGIISAVEEMGVRVPDQLEVAIRFSHQPERLRPFPVIAWQPDIPGIAKALVSAEMQVLRGETPMPAMKYIRNLRIPKLDRPWEMDPSEMHRGHPAGATG